MSESKPSKVSVIIVVHSTYLPYLRNAVAHLKGQNCEIIVVGNGCIVDMAGVNAISCGNTTLANSCNLGIQAARGEYIVRVDADDWVDSELIEKERKFLDENPEVDCVWCDYIQAHTHVSGEGYEVFTLDHDPQTTLEHACGAMYRKSVWQELGGYDSSLKFQESYDFWIRFNQSGFKAERLEVPLYLYRKGHESMSTSPEREKVRKEIEAKHGQNSRSS